MSHNLHLDARSGEYAMFSARGNGRAEPWHKLGQRITGAATWQDAIALAHLDWTVTKQQLRGPAGTPIPAFGTFRSDKPGDAGFLGAVGDVYEPVQNRDAFAWIDALLGVENGAHYECAGALGNGSRIWALASVPYSFEVVAGDRLETYLLAESSHDGSKAASIRLTTIRVVCQNTLSAALSVRGNLAVKIRHTTNVKTRMDEAIRAMSTVRATVDGLKVKLQTLAGRKVDRQLARASMDKLFGPDWRDSTRQRNQVEDIARLFESNDRNAIPAARGTAYNLLNACTEYADHYRPVRITDGKQGLSTQTVRAEGALFGTADDFKNKAIDAILAATAHAPTVEPSLTVPTSRANPKLDAILDAVSL